MKLSPNIDRRGRRVRLTAGILIDVCGAALLIAGIGGHGSGFLIAGIVAMILGSFTIFEAANGWCVFRAMGIKTRI